MVKGRFLRVAGACLIALVAGFLILGQLDRPTTRLVARTGTLKGQTVLVSRACPSNQTCTATLAPCGLIGNIVLDGSASVSVTDPKGSVVWKDELPTGHVNEGFVPGLLFGTELTMTVVVGSRQHMRFIVYGKQVSC